MPVPHEVTKEFFIPTEDESIFGNENQNAAQSIEERIGNLLFLFNLIDATFGRNMPDDLPPRPTNNDEAENEEDENDEDEDENIPENEMYDEETEHMAEDIREVPINHVSENEQQPADENQQENDDGENDHHEGENAHLTRHVIRLDEFDLLALPLLLMRSRARRNEEAAARQNNQPQESNESENEQEDPAMDPLLRIFSRAFGPHQ